MKNRKLTKIRITTGISFSKTRSKWICSWCEQPIRSGEETILFQGIQEYGLDKFSEKMGGARVHLDCIPHMCKSIKNVKEDKDKYTILNTLTNDNQ